MIFPLAEVYKEKKTLAGFFDDLLQALRSEESARALEELHASQLRKKRWGWLSKYTEMKPGIFGFKVDAGQVLKDVLS
jgi:hypothetical protein